MKIKIPVEVDLNGIDGIVDEIKRLQTYKLFEGDDMVLVSLDDVAEILMNHIEAKRKSEPQKMRGKWETIEGWDGDEVYRCSECGEEYVLIDGTPKENSYHFCPNCGAWMGGQNETD